MAGAIPLVLPAFMSRVQASIALSAEAFSSLQTDQSSARAETVAMAITQHARSMEIGRRIFDLMAKLERNIVYGRGAAGTTALLSVTNFARGAVILSL